MRPRLLDLFCCAGGAAPNPKLEDFAAAAGITPVTQPPSQIPAGANTREFLLTLLRIVDSCGGAEQPDEPADWSRGYNEALDAVERELKRFFNRDGMA